MSSANCATAFWTFRCRSWRPASRSRSRFASAKSARPLRRKNPIGPAPEELCSGGRLCKQASPETCAGFGSGGETTMRTIPFFASVALVLPMFCHAQQASPDGLACFENLATPEFPQAALQAHVDGSVWTTTHVSPQGTVDKIETQVVSAWSDGPKMLTPPVEKAIRAAKIK